MTEENFRHLMNDADANGNIDIDDVVALKVKNESAITRIDSSILDIKLGLSTELSKRKEILQYLDKFVFIVYLDKYGNGYSRIIY
jgi:hypothetical protein